MTGTAGAEAAAEHTAVRVALWRALHLRADPPPYVVEDEAGLRLADPGEGWRERPDMDAAATRRRAIQKRRPIRTIRARRAERARQRSINARG